MKPEVGNTLLLQSCYTPTSGNGEMSKFDSKFLSFSDINRMIPVSGFREDLISDDI